MNKPHASLKASTNVALIILWALAVVMILFTINTWPIIMLVAGAILGLIGGIMQTLSFKESKRSFKEARTMIEVRNSLKNTKWGKRYLVFLWSGNILLVTIALIATKTPISSVLVGYFTLMFVREVITLKSTIELNNA